MSNSLSIEFTDFLKTKSTEFINKLSDLVKIQTIETLPEEFKNILRDIGDKVIESVVALSTEIEKITSNIQSDTLNIGFFGETNTGKSTLIEAFIGGDGSSIGTGMKDFTKNIVEYNLKLSNIERSIKLIDMPGIEGKEQHFIEKIKEAVYKSHIVFYVTTAAKEPERETLVKVRDYLNKKAKVFVILNKRMGVESYKYKRVLIDDNIKKVIDRTKILVQKELDNFFSGKIIVVDAHLAFLSMGKIKEGNRFEKNMEKALSIFSSKSEISSFSGIKYLMNVVSEVSNPYRMNIEIKRTNFYKILGEMEKIIAHILRNKKDLDQKMRDLISENDKVINEIKTYWHQSSRYILTSGDSEINRVCNEIKGQLYKAIENNKEVSNSYIEREIKNSLRSIEDKIRAKIDEISDYIQKRLKTHSEKIDISISILKRQKDLSLNLEELLNKTKMEIEDYLERAFKAAIPFIIGLITGGIGLILGIIKAIWDIFKTKDEQIAEKKRNVSDKIKSIREELIKSIHDKLNRELFKMNRTLCRIENNISNLERFIKLIIREIDSGIEELRRIRREVTSYFLKQILFPEDINVKCGYVDLSLSGALLIIDNPPKIEISKIAKILNLRESNVLVFSNESQILEFINDINNNPNFPDNVKELILRGLNSLKDNLKIYKISRDKINKKIEIIFQNGGAS